jgi:ribosomal protein L40E
MRDGPRRWNDRHVLLRTILALVLLPLLAVPAVAAPPLTGTLSGTVEIVGSTELRDGEVVVTRAGSDEVVATAPFNSSEPEFMIELPFGTYTAYATAPVYHASPRFMVNISVLMVTRLNLTVVRIEEVIGHVNSTAGAPLEGVSVSFSLNGSVSVTATTDAGGVFRKTIEPGNYTVRALKAGFGDVTSTVRVARGEVVRLDLVMEAAGGDDDDEGPSALLLGVVMFVLLSISLSFGFMSFQARRIRRAMEEAEARREKGAVCPECGADVPAGAAKCVRCGFHFQVRCARCGRLTDLKSAGGECPSCGALLK